MSGLNEALLQPFLPKAYELRMVKFSGKPKEQVAACEYAIQMSLIEVDRFIEMLLEEDPSDIHELLVFLHTYRIKRNIPNIPKPGSINTFLSELFEIFLHGKEKIPEWPHDLDFSVESVALVMRNVQAAVSRTPYRFKEDYIR